jgi:hypothetical protein
MLRRLDLFLSLSKPVRVENMKIRMQEDNLIRDYKNGRVVLQRIS